MQYQYCWHFHMSIILHVQYITEYCHVLPNTATGLIEPTKFTQTNDHGSLLLRVSTPVVIGFTCETCVGWCCVPFTKVKYFKCNIDDNGNAFVAIIAVYYYHPTLILQQWWQYRWWFVFICFFASVLFIVLSLWFSLNVSMYWALLRAYTVKIVLLGLGCR